ncbi:MAG: hypothetical protein MUF48_19200 [Pirellulaceae bacterium]|nr:hypothetical protein [Pirellulaceae bacterium]
MIGDDRAGATLRCDACGREVSIPRIEAPAPPPTPAAVETPDSPVIFVDARVSSRTSSGPAARRRDIRRLAISLSLLAALSSLPLVLESWPARDLHVLVAAPWAAAVTLLGSLQVAYAVYLYQLPDAGAARVVSFFTLAAATAYAVVAGMAWWTAPDHPLMAWLALDRNLFSARQESLWCFLLSVLLGTMSYVAARLAKP